MRKLKLKSIGQIPGSVVYTGEKTTKESIVNMVDYNEEQVQQSEVLDFSECKDYLRHGVKWIDFVGVDQIKDLEEFGKLFELHPLTLEDIANVGQRPKIEDMEDYMFLTLKMFRFDSNEDKIKEEQISLVLGEKYVISFQEDEDSDDFSSLRDRILKGKGKIRKMKSDYLLYSIVDAIVDQYFVVLEHIEEKIEVLQDELITNPTPATLPKIQYLKQELIALRKSIRPVREIINAIQKTDSDLIHEELGTYLRDVYDHTIQIIDTIETFRDIIAGSLDIYLSTISNRMNEVMKVLTIIGTIFIPLTFIVGVYGMNFKYMPEFAMKGAYPALWVIMLSIVAGMLRFFRRKKWI
ncbi:MAG: magnesium/cobalt transporter CorA [Candidatus Absconditabacteria bacterium]|nr:magnesium/cobalt transporter CorA [Candidatus Absconditabacteria bacterium]